MNYLYIILVLFFLTVISCRPNNTSNKISRADLRPADTLTCLYDSSGHKIRYVDQFLPYGKAPYSVYCRFDNICGKSEDKTKLFNQVLRLDSLEDLSIFGISLDKEVNLLSPLCRFVYFENSSLNKDFNLRFESDSIADITFYKSYFDSNISLLNIIRTNNKKLRNLYLGYCNFNDKNIIFPKSNIRFLEIYTSDSLKIDIKNLSNIKDIRITPKVKLVMTEKQKEQVKLRVL